MLSKIWIWCLILQKNIIEGDGTNKRTFIHVEDIANALICIIKENKIGEIYNIGSNYEITIKDLAKKLIKIIKNTDNYDQYIEYIPDRVYNDTRYNINYNKLMKTGWKQIKDFDIEIKKIIH